MLEVRTKCVNSERCEPCPIAALADPGDRVWAGNIVSSSVRHLKASEVVAADVTVAQMQQTVEHFAEQFGQQALIEPAVGALAVTLAKNCNVK